jgi:hypothetical protein
MMSGFEKFAKERHIYGISGLELLKLLSTNYYY